MQRHKLKAAVLICAAASLATAVAPASASTGTQSPADVVIVDCFSHPQVRPNEFLIACGDGNSILTALRWSDWKPNFAAGRGLNVVNDCQPFCAAGTFHPYPVTVRLDRSEPLNKNPHQRHYTQLRLVFTDSRPSEMPRVVTYRLWS
ncbi:hypothetical protein AB0N06_13595 [Streptomyces sp. NPDC051020]|uniref:hypothetical protein n=1 Tax=Streptomyces sp. NPDC051020 TaxID=3155409 RepID=UPI0034424A5A